MNDHNVETVAAGKARPSSFGAKHVLLLVLALGVLAWTGRKLWDDLNADSATKQFQDTIAKLQSDEPSERWRAAGNLSAVNRVNDVELAVPALTRALEDKDAQVKTTAARSLGSLISHMRNPQDDQVVQPELIRKWSEAATRALVKSLSDPDAAIRASVVAGLGLVAKQSLPSSGGGMAGRTPMIGGGAMAKKPIRQPPPELVEALENGSTKWSRATAQEYYGYTDDAPPAELVAALQDGSADVRLAVVQALESYPLGLDSAIPTLLSMLEKDEPSIREACPAALKAAWPSASVIPELLPALKSGSPEVRALAIFLLGRTGPEASAAVPTLLAILKEPPDSAASGSALAAAQQDPPCAAARALGEISSSDEAIAALTDTLNSDLTYRHGAAAYGLAQIGPPAVKAAPALVAAYTKWLDSKNPANNIGRAMTNTVGRIAPQSPVAKEAIAALVRALDFRDGPVRTQAAEALAKFGKGAESALPKLRELKEKTRSDQVRDAATAAIDAIDASSKPKAPEAQTL